MTIKHGKKVAEALRCGDFSSTAARVVLTPGEMVRLLRQKNELSQNKLAQKASLSQATISSIENGRVQLGIERAKLLARALHVHPAVLLFQGWDVDKRSAA